MQDQKTTAVAFRADFPRRGKAFEALLSFGRVHSGELVFRTTNDGLVLEVWFLSVPHPSRTTKHKGEGDGVLRYRCLEIHESEFDHFFSTAPICGRLEVDMLVDTLARSSAQHILSMSACENAQSVKLTFSDGSRFGGGEFEIDFADTKVDSDVPNTLSVGFPPVTTSVAMPGEFWQKVLGGKSRVYDVVRIQVEMQRVCFSFSAPKCHGRVEFHSGGEVSIATTHTAVLKQVSLGAMQDFACILDFAASPVHLLLYENALVCHLVARRSKHGRGCLFIQAAPRFVFFTAVGIRFSFWF